MPELSSVSSQRMVLSLLQKRRSQVNCLTSQEPRKEVMAGAARRSFCSIRAPFLCVPLNVSQIFIYIRNVIGGVAGLTADANSLVNHARSAAQRHLLAYNEDIPVELLAQKICDLKQGYTQFGGASPLIQFWMCEIDSCN